MTNAVNLASAAGTGFAFRNRIINGDMRIDQRNGGAAITSGYPVDRWRLDTTNQASFSLQRNAGSVTPPLGFSNYIGATSAASYTPATNTTALFSQPIEGFNAADFMWGTANATTVTLSFWVRSSLTGTHSGAIANSAGTRSYVFSFTISAANTWEYKTIVVPGDTSGVWATDNTQWGTIRFNLGTGSGTYGSTSIGWQAGSIVGLTTAVQVSATNGATFYLTGVQLEVGSVATPFERRPYGLELALCQRYYCETRASGRFYASGSGHVLENHILWPVQMRAIPTVTLTSGNIRSNMFSGYPQVQNISVYGARYLVASNTTGDTYAVNDKVTADIEL